MRSPTLLLLLGALLASAAAVHGSVHTSTPLDVEIEILPSGGDGEPTSAEVMAKLQQLMTTEEGRESLREKELAGLLPEELSLGKFSVMAPEVRRPVDLTAAVTLSEDELTLKVKRLQAYKHLIELGAVKDADVVRSALMASGGNVPRAAIELRKAVERATGFRQPTPEDEEVEVEIEILPAASGPSTSELVAKLEKLLDTEGGRAKIAESLMADPYKEWRLLTVCGVMALAIVALVGGGQAVRIFRDAPTSAEGGTQPTAGASLVENLERLTALKSSGELSQLEFASAKRQLLAEKEGDGGSSPTSGAITASGATAPPATAASWAVKRAISCPDGWGGLPRGSASEDGSASPTHSRAAGSLHSTPRRMCDHQDESVSILTQQQRWCSL